MQMANALATRNVSICLGTPKIKSAPHLGGKALDVVLLGVERALGHKQRKVGVLHAHRLDALVEERLDGLPDRERVRDAGCSSLAAPETTASFSAFSDLTACFMLGQVFMLCFPTVTAAIS